MSQHLRLLEAGQTVFLQLPEKEKLAIYIFDSDLVWRIQLMLINPISRWRGFKYIYIFDAHN